MIAIVMIVVESANSQATRSLRTEKGVQKKETICVRGCMRGQACMWGIPESKVSSQPSNLQGKQANGCSFMGNSAAKKS